MEKNYEAIIRNLKDADFDDETIEKFMTECKCGNLKKEMSMLECQRKTLLDGLHAKQKQIDCLDFLAYKLKKEE